MKVVRILIVDGSIASSQFVKRALEQDSEIQIVACCQDPFEARQRLIEHTPDVMILNLNLEKLDAVVFLQKVIKHFPTPTLIVVDPKSNNPEKVQQAIFAGALDRIPHPTQPSPDASAAFSLALRAKIKSVAGRAAPGGDEGGIVASNDPMPRNLCLAIAASTGGPEAARAVLKDLPENIPSTVLILHMPPYFTSTYARNLQRVVPFRVKEAEQGDELEPGLVLVAPGDFHMEVKKYGSVYRIHLHQEPLLHGVRPAADYLLNSVAKAFRSRAVGVILTGMGRDGAAGLAEMRKFGAKTIAQDEKTSVVFGMPKAAIDIGAADMILPLPKIPDIIYKELVRLQRRVNKIGNAS